MKLGQKIKRSAHALGRKIDRSAHRLGHKCHDVLSKVQGASNKIAGKIEHGIHQVRKGVDVADKVVDAVSRSGVAGAIPLPGAQAAVYATSRGLHGIRKGLDKGDNALHKYKQKSDKLIEEGKKHAASLEKFNVRKKLAEAANPDDGFA